MSTTTDTARQVTLAGIEGRWMARAGLLARNPRELAALSTRLRIEHPELDHAELGLVLAGMCRAYAATHPDPEPLPLQAFAELAAAVQRATEHARRAWLQVAAELHTPLERVRRQLVLSR